MTRGREYECAWCRDPDARELRAWPISPFTARTIRLCVHCARIWDHQERALVPLPREE